MRDMDHEVFVSYASLDCERVLQIVSQLEAAGVRVWLDADKIEGATNYGPEIVRGIRECKVLALMCTDASMRSRNVKQEILLAWKYERPYLPLLLESISFPEQVEYWLEGWQWVEILERPAQQWLPRVLRAFVRAGVQCLSADQVPPSVSEQQIIQPKQLHQSLDSLLSIASFTDQIWPIPAERAPRGTTRSALRDLGAPQDNVQHGYRLGSRVRLAIEAEREGYLLLLDKGPSGKVYCLCPSHFAPDTRLLSGCSYFPQKQSKYGSFVVSGQPGREELLAIITHKPLGLDLKPIGSAPAHVLASEDITTLIAKLRDLDGDSWTVLSTYFDVVI